MLHVGNRFCANLELCVDHSATMLRRVPLMDTESRAEAAFFILPLALLMTMR